MKKYIYISILVIGIVISSFFNIKNSPNKNNISESSKDKSIAIFIEGEQTNSFPTTNNYEGRVECYNKNGTINDIIYNVSWNGQKWVTSISNIKNGNIKCNIYFTEVEDTGEYRVGQKVILLTQSNGTSSSWLTTTNGYNKDTGKYSLTNTYVNASSTFEKENLEWYVWKKEDNKITLLSATPTSTKLSLNYAKSYNNGLFFMNDICSKIYGGNIDGVTARSINMVDILEKVFEYKKEVTYNNTTVTLVDENGKADNTIIINNLVPMRNVINALFNTEYGTYFTNSSGANKYVPYTIYNAGKGTTNAVYYSSTYANNIRNLENNLITEPVTTTTRSNTSTKPAQWTYSITDWTDLIDSDSLQMLTSESDFWIASRDFGFASNTSGAAVYYGIKYWTNNTVVPKTIYKSNVTSGQTSTSAGLRPMLEIDLTKVQINDDGSLSAIE